jgi:hypothetical protein
LYIAPAAVSVSYDFPHGRINVVSHTKTGTPWKKKRGSQPQAPTNCWCWPNLAEWPDVGRGQNSARWAHKRRDREGPLRSAVGLRVPQVGISRRKYKAWIARNYRENLVSHAQPSKQDSALSNERLPPTYRVSRFLKRVQQGCCGESEKVEGYLFRRSGSNPAVAPLRPADPGARPERRRDISTSAREMVRFRGNGRKRSGRHHSRLRSFPAYPLLVPPNELRLLTRAL